MIEITGLHKTFHREIISDFNISFPTDKTSVILGPSGCGKTTLFNIMAGLDTEHKGIVNIDERVSYIFQEDRLIPWLTSEENLQLVAGQNRDNKIDSILEKFHLAHKKNTRARELSGGEKQRLSIARAFLHDSRVVLMDEALRSMDLSLKLKIISEINTVLKEYRKTMVVISHDIREALLLADTIYVLDKDPMRDVERIELTAPKEERNLYDEDILHMEKKLYNLLLR